MVGAETYPLSYGGTHDEENLLPRGFLRYIVHLRPLFRLISVFSTDRSFSVLNKLKQKKFAIWHLELEHSQPLQPLHNAFTRARSYEAFAE